ncbi:MAG: MBL fold metallo-hydrolase [Oscillospiraceae bacterium]|nr:MBL fold metallo-hydrolase [Oscillospiraceae bacterium]
MLVKTLPVGYLKANCHVVSDEKSGEALVVDPGGNPEIIMAYLNENGLKCKYIMLTHAHDDHCKGVQGLMAETGALCYMHERDVDLQMRRRIKGGYEMYKSFEEPENIQLFKEGDKYPLGELEIEIIETPGHTMGGVTIKCHDALFTGDTLFKMSTGRADLGGDFDTELRSLKKLADLYGNYDVYPGHGDPTTLQFERDNNPYMKQAIEKF